MSAEAAAIPQHLAALQLANQRKLQRACVKRALKRDEMELAEALRDPAVQRMRVYDLLCCLPARANGGKGRQLSRAHQLATRLLAALGPVHSPVVGNLTDRQRLLLIAAWEDRRP